MRSLVVLFFFFILLFGVGTIVLSVNTPADAGAASYDFALGQFSGANRADRNGPSIVVDRYDDGAADLPCAAEANDCNLRSAIRLANNDGQPTTITFADSYLITLLNPLPALTADGTVIKASLGQEVHLNGNSTAASVLRITGANVEIRGLRIYGAGAGYPNVAISEDAHGAIVAQNTIGDDDAPVGNCGSSDSAYGGIYVDATGDFGDGYRAWIYANTIECHRGVPGDGITIRSDKVIVGSDETGNESAQYRNIIRLNNGFGVNLTDAVGNTVSANDLVQNTMGGLYISNFHNNNIMYNDIVDASS